MFNKTYVQLNLVHSTTLSYFTNMYSVDIEMNISAKSERSRGKNNNNSDYLLVRNYQIILWVIYECNASINSCSDNAPRVLHTSSWRCKHTLLLCWKISATHNTLQLLILLNLFLSYTYLQCFYRTIHTYYRTLCNKYLVTYQVDIWDFTLTPLIKR